MNLTKLEAATHQLGVAIQLFLSGDYLSSVTLAGAAEEILGRLSERAGLAVAVDEIAKFHLADVDEAVPVKKRWGVLIRLMNRGRNQAKHADDAEESHVEVEQVWPLQMIMRALPMAKNLGAEIALESAMREWIRTHPEAFE